MNACTRAPKTPTSITIGVQPNERDRGLPKFQEELQRRLGMEVKIFVPKDYAELIAKFKSGEVSFAFFAPLMFIQAEREAGAKALLKKIYGNSEFYYAAILVKASSPYKKVEDLKGKRFGFVDPKSTSGFLFPRLLLKSVGFDPVDGPHEFLGTHQDSVRALLDGKVDAVGVWAEEPGTKKGAWTEAPFKASDSRVLVISDPIPNDAFAVQESFYQAHPMLVFRVMEAMIGIADDKEKVLKQVFNVDGLATATTRHYESVRALEGLLREKSETAH